jgi:flagellar hook-basal body complex protein FliE
MAMSIASAKNAAQEVLAQIREIQSESRKSGGNSIGRSEQGGTSFMDHLKNGLAEVNEMQKKADSMAMEVASGKSENLHETMLATSQAELTFNLMVQLRNRALEAYQEVMRMPV